MKEDIGRLRQYIERELARGEKKLGRPHAALVIATSGTAAALAEASVAMSAKLPVRRASPKAGAAGKFVRVQAAGRLDRGRPPPGR